MQLIPRAAFVLFLLTASCAKCAPELVAQGASRLTIRTFGAVVELVNNDERCGFKSERVLNSVKLEDGRAIYTVENCTINVAQTPSVSTDCSGTTTTVQGKVIVSATRTVEGALTGDPSNPVVPEHPDAVRIEIQDAVLKNFLVESDAIDAKMTVFEGAVSGVAEPRLARSASLGVCKVPTREIRFSDVTWGASTARIQSDGHDFEVDIGGSDLSAVLGVHGARENDLLGTISVWGEEHSIPVEGDEDGLLPGYERDAHRASFACTEDLTDPYEYRCDSLGDLVASGAARLTVLSFGTLVKLVETECRYNTQSITGNLGDAGEGVFTLPAQGCLIDLSFGSVVSENCHGEKTYASGRIVARGKKTLRGVVTGSDQDPIIPTMREPAEVEMTFMLQDFEVSSDTAPAKLSVRSGGLSGKARPRLGVDTEKGVCSKRTPEVRFEGLAWQDAEARIETGARKLEVRIDRSSLAANVGENTVEGTIVVDGEEHEASGMLDAAFDRARFLQSFACEPNFRPARTDDDCALERKLADGVARLTIRSLGALTSMINNDRRCGFERFLTKINPSEERDGMLAHEVESCELGSDIREVAGTDCLGVEKYIGGRANISARRVVHGRSETVLFFFGSIVPLTPDAVTLELDVELDDFELYTSDGPRLILRSGRVRATVQPMLGEMASERGRFEVATPVAYMSNVVLENVRATVVAEGKTLNALIEHAELEAQNGSFGTRANALRGWVKIKNQHIDLGLSALDPDFTQASFDRSYVCTADLLATVPSASVPPPSL
jgi:hypothetical protein